MARRKTKLLPFLVAFAKGECDGVGIENETTQVATVENSKTRCDITIIGSESRAISMT